MADPFERYFEEYARAFDDFDEDRIASFFHCPCFMVNHEFVGSLTTERAIVDNMRGLLVYHRAQGYDHGSVSDIRVEYQAENLAIVRVRWRIFKAESKLLWDFVNTYNLADHGDGWKILISTTHASAA